MTTPDRDPIFQPKTPAGKAGRAKARAWQEIVELVPQLGEHTNDPQYLRNMIKNNAHSDVVNSGLPEEQVNEITKAINKPVGEGLEWLKKHSPDEYGG